jgi:hypothetical protein
MKRRPPIGFLFESLEPRLLMAGDFGALNDLAGAADMASMRELAALHDLTALFRITSFHHVPAFNLPRTGVDETLKVDEQKDALLVLDNKHGGAVVDTYSLDSNQPISIRGTVFADKFTLSLDPSAADLPQINITGGLGNDTIIGPSAGASWALQSSGKGYVGDVAFKGIEQLSASGSGKDSLSGPIQGANWTIDGDGNGTVLRTGFAGFGLLQGSDHGSDIFRIDPKGGSTAQQALNHGTFSIDGGKGGKDQIIVEGNNFQTGQFTRTGVGAGEFDAAARNPGGGICDRHR